MRRGERRQKGGKEKAASLSLTVRGEEKDHKRGGQSGFSSIRGRRESVDKTGNRRFFLFKQGVTKGGEIEDISHIKSKEGRNLEEKTKEKGGGDGPSFFFKLAREGKKGE